MKKLLLALLLASPLLAQHRFDVEGAALYMRRAPGALDFASSGILPTPSQNIVVSTLKPGYYWGARVAEGYTSSDHCAFFRLAGLYLSGCDSAVVAGADLFPIFIPVAEQQTASRVSARINSDYWNLDLRIGFYLFRTCPLEMGFYGGARYGYFRELLRCTSVTDEGPLSSSEKLIFSGAGPQLGFQCDYRLCFGLGIRGSVTTAALIGQRKTDAQVMLASEAMSMHGKFPNNVSVIPAVDLRLGLQWLFDTCNLGVRTEIGWELDYYWGAFDRDGSSAAGQEGFALFGRRPTDIGFSGPFFSATLLF